VAGPVFRAAANASVSAGATSITPALPTLDTNGSGLLLAVCLTKNNATHFNGTSGWTLVSQVNSGASFTVSLWKALQSAAAPAFSWTGSVACSSQVMYYTDPANAMDVANVSLLGAAGTGTTSPHSSAGANTTLNNVLAVYFDGCATATALTNPAGWTSEFTGTSATSGTAHNWGDKPIATSGSASGAISITGGNAAWVQWQIQVSGQSATAGLQVSKADASAFVEPKTGFAASKAGAVAWVETNDFRVAKMSVAAWLDTAPGIGRRMSFM
jgi:hypothetical protein